ncbi:TPA: hypothetical protein ACPZHP_000181 [Yersinia enterocolitica]|uniref:hypothetical protein n=2 Tax=Yersinia enterocolitica TaxID=630 RepID=UPI0021E8DFEF|nr:hypothetical protein [Yersinia enterocolitica]UYJ99427.1 hypothetical protein N4W06_10435 [Yersinia enterocolitica]
MKKILVKSIILVVILGAMLVGGLIDFRRGDIEAAKRIKVDNYATTFQGQIEQLSDIQKSSGGLLDVVDDIGKWWENWNQNQEK